MTQTVIALLGQRYKPTDAVEEYCRHLAEALTPAGIQLEIRRVPWEIHGWPESLNVLKLIATQWRGTWVLVQYTTEAWSANGFPRKVLLVIKILKAAGARVGIVFHGVEPAPGATFVRRFAQLRAMRRALALAEIVLFTAPREKWTWLSNKKPSARNAFLPAGPPSWPDTAAQFAALLAGQSPDLGPN
jgi:hypothetical protein